MEDNIQDTLIIRSKLMTGMDNIRSQNSDIYTERRSRLACSIAMAASAADGKGGR
jgi:hypothetical protein